MYNCTTSSPAYFPVLVKVIVASNFSLVPGWADEVARHHIISRFNDDYRFKLASSLHQRYYRVNSLAAIEKLDPRAEAVGLNKHVEGKYSEGAGLLILDEAQLIFNARKWEKNMDWITFQFPVGLPPAISRSATRLSCASINAVSFPCATR